MDIANAAFVDGEYEEALSLYDKVAEENPTKADTYIKRAACKMALENFSSAIEDCSRALKLEPKAATAHWRQGVCFFELEEYESAKECFARAVELNTNNRRFRMWLRKSESELALGDILIGDKKDKEAFLPAAANSIKADDPSLGPVTLPGAKDPPKYSFYQSHTHITVELMQRNASPENTTIQTSEKEVSISIKLDADREYNIDIDLWDRIIPTESKVHYGATKIEIKLQKAKPGRWDTLESKTVQQQAKDVREYPSSKGPKNWDNISSTIKDEKKEGEDALNDFFRQIYAHGNEEIRRAMNKSFQESGGTVLSTNWGEVGTKTVEGSAPKGMDMKKWNNE